jgi:tetratricopeptide (TPR) repeat protein
VFSFPIFIRASIGLGVLACAACADTGAKSAVTPAPQVFYTVTGEIALARSEPRVAALQYAAVAQNETDPQLLKRAAEVTAQTLQPSLTAGVAARWIYLDPKSLDAQRAAAKAALALYKIDEAAEHYRIIISTSPLGVDAEFAELDLELGSTEGIFGARQLADKLVLFFPSSAAALRLQGMTALRADDPAAAVRALASALAMDAADGDEAQRSARKDLSQTLARARVTAGDIDAPLKHAQEQLNNEDTPANRFDYAVLLMTAQRLPEATAQFEILAKDPDSKPVALRLIGLLEFQQGNFEAAAARFKQLLKTDKFLDDAFYYLGLIADRNEDPELALRLYAQVQSGDNVVPALLRAASLLQTNGAPEAADELLDRLIEDEPQRAPEILTARARIYAQSNELPKAFAVLDGGALQYPDSVEMRYASASLYEQDGRVSDALRELKLVVKSRPNDPAALNALGFTLADHSKELARARKMIERAYAAAPKNAAILDSLGWVLYRQGQAAQALPYLNAAYSADHDGDIAAHFGEVLWQLGEHDQALKIWSQASILEPDNRLIKSTRQRLQPTH